MLATHLFKRIQVRHFSFVDLNVCSQSLFCVHYLGPHKWCESFKIANGPRQSPIDIIPESASYDSSLKPLTLKYDPSTSLEILNNGHSFQVTFADDEDSSSLCLYLYIFYNNLLKMLYEPSDYSIINH